MNFLWDGVKQAADLLTSGDPDTFEVVGITLRMTPQIIDDDYVRLTVFEEVSDIDPLVSEVVGDPSLVGPTTTVLAERTVVALSLIHI